MSGTQTAHQNGQPDSDPDLLGDKKDAKHESDWNHDIPIKKLPRTNSERLRETLSREFKNPNDQEELGKIMGGDGEKLLALVDDIRKIESLRSIELDIPQVCTPRTIIPV
jgi:hypothetical protein